MSAIYRTKEGDRLDVICYNFYGQSDQVVRVLEANPRLAETGATLPAGLVIQLPELPAPTTTTIRLWG